MKVLMENFSENIRDEIPETDQLEQFHYKQEEQEKEEDKLRKAVIDKQKGFVKEIFFDFEKKIIIQFF
jgi:hypothetical protein